MNKMKKLLSVVLAVILAFSALSVLGMAAKTNYKTVANLESLGAYSPYGQVSRLSTEERMSIVADALDVLLAQLNLNMGTIDATVVELYLNFTSIDELCKSIDSIDSALNGIVVTLGSAILNLGIIEDLNTDTWQTGMSRDSQPQLTIAKEIFEFLAANTGLVETVLEEGISLGVIESLVTLDLGDINEIVKNLPKLIKEMLFPMFERWDQTKAECDSLESAITGNASAISTIEWVVKNYFARPMSLQTVKADATGKITSDHTLPSGQTHRRQFVKEGVNIRVYQYYTQSAVDADETDDITAVGYKDVGVYYLQKEYDDANAPYVFVHTDEFGNETTLKHYADGTEWLPEFAAALNAGTETFSISTTSGLDLLYKMIPYVFDSLAVVVLNGTVMKALSTLFGVNYKYVGKIEADGTPDATVKALPGYDASIDVFGPEGDYVWEWSEFAEVEADGVKHYYWRFEDQLFKGDTTYANEYMAVFNWDYEITGDFLDEFIPASATGKSEAGYSRILQGLNDGLVKLANGLFNYTELGITAPVEGDNSKLISNIQKVAQAFVNYAPWNIFGYEGEDKEDRDAYDAYYQLFMDTNPDVVLVGIAAFAIDALAPQMHLPSAESIKSQGLEVGALLAAMLRELASQLLPSANYDALIYTDYNTNTFVAGKDNSYWLDVILTMGVDIGFKYLRNLADLDEDKAAWTALGYSESKTYALDTFTADPQAWEDYVDYIIDWALTVDASGDTCVWSMANLVDMDGYTVDMASAQDPWAKLDHVLDSILFLDQFTSETNLENGLRGTILDLINLEWGNVLGTPSNAGIVDIPATSKLVTTNLLNCLTTEVKDLLNGLFVTVGGGSYSLIPSSITTADDLLVQDNIKTLASGLVGALDDFYNNGLLVTALPILNFFLGWKVDPQVYAEPEITLVNTYSYAYMFSTDGSTVNATINLRNAASGMLEKHRNSSVVDQPYALKVTSITLDNAQTVTATGLDTFIQPGDIGSISVSFPYSKEEGVTLDIAYQFVGKDGAAIGGTQHKYVHQWVSSATPDELTRTAYDGYDAGCDGPNMEISERDAYIISNNIKAPEGYIHPWKNRGEDKNAWVSAFEVVTAPASPYAFVDTATFVHGESENKSLNPNGAAKHTKSEDTDKGNIWNFYPYTLADEDYEFESGTSFSLGQYKMTWKDGNGSYTFTVACPVFYYYDYTSLETLYNSVYNVVRDDYPAATDTEWNAFVAARHAATEPLIGPRKVATFATDYSRDTLDGLEADLQDAYDALNESLLDSTGASATGASTKDLEAALALDSSINGDEINFQDFTLYEYWAYEERRTAARNLLKGMVAPEILDTYYIEGSALTEEEIDAIIDAETNAFIANGITASRSENDADAIAASQSAHDNFVAPVYTDLYIDDQAALLNYYRGFLTTNKVTANLAFITKEIGYADANYPVNDATAALYTEGSWNAYVEAYNAAKAITTDNTPSETFEAKYNLMVKMNELLLKEDSFLLKNESAGVLAANVEKAQAIFASLEAGDGQWALVEGADAETAYAELISALGYYYEDENEDGETVEYNLYADSALEYLDNDRPNRSTNQRKVDAANGALEAALANFEEASLEPNTLILNPNAPFEAIIDTTNTCGEAYNGTVYGFDTLGMNDSFEIDGTIADFLSTAYGDDYLEVVVSEDTGIETTGTIINVLDAEGNVIETYVYIFYGDIDMDGVVGASDAMMAEYYEFAYEGIDTYEQFMAADVDGDAFPGAGDAMTMEYFEFAYEGMPTQAEIGANNVNNYYEMI